MRDEVPEPWASAMRTAQIHNPNSDAVSIRMLAVKAGFSGPETVRRLIRGYGSASPDTIRRVADALKVDELVVSKWAGQARTVRESYEPPNEADLMSTDERKAVDRIIRLLTKGREAGEVHGRESATKTDAAVLQMKTAAADKGKLRGDSDRDDARGS